MRPSILTVIMLLGFCLVATFRCGQEQFATSIRDMRITYLEKANASLRRQLSAMDTIKIEFECTHCKWQNMLYAKQDSTNPFHIIPISENINPK